MNYDILQMFREKVEHNKVEDHALEAAIDPVRSHLNGYFYDTKHNDGKSKIFGSFLRGTAVPDLNSLDLLYVLPENFRHHIARQENKEFYWLAELLFRIFSGSPWEIVPDDRSQSFLISSAKPWPIKLKPVFQFNNDVYRSLSLANDDAGSLFRPFVIETEFRSRNFISNQNLEILLKTVRYWAAKNNVQISGYFIDCMAMEFISKSPYFRFANEYHDCILRDFFRFLSEIEPQQDSWNISGVNERIYRTGKFERQALEAFQLAERMIANALIRQDGEANFALRRLVGDIAI